MWQFISGAIAWMKPSLIIDRNEKNDAIKTLNENKKSAKKRDGQTRKRCVRKTKRTTIMSASTRNGLNSNDIKTFFASPKQELKIITLMQHHSNSATSTQTEYWILFGCRNKNKNTSVARSERVPGRHKNCENKRFRSSLVGVRVAKSRRRTRNMRNFLMSLCNILWRGSNCCRCEHIFYGTVRNGGTVSGVRAVTEVDKRMPHSTN